MSANNNPIKKLPFGSVHVIDVEEVEGLKLEREVRTDFISQQPKRRGRPKGSMGKVNEDHELTLSDFSYIRAVIQGIAPVKAANRYLGDKIRITKASCAEYEIRVRSLLQRVIKVLLSEDMQDQARKYLDVLNAPPLQEVTLGPSLEEFASQWDSDMYSEAELQDLYIDQFGDPLAGANGVESLSNGYSIKSKINAVNWLSNWIAKKPRAQDPIELWVHASVVKKLHEHGVITAGNLMDWVNLQGRTFHLRLSGFGVTRARRMALWLMDNEESIGRRLNRRVRLQTVDTSDATDAVVLREYGPTTVQEFGIVPMEAFAWPAALMGQDGVFRSSKANTFGASNDFEAIQAWLKTLEGTASPATQLSYTRAIERLVLWAIVERRTALSSLVTQSFIEFREFLRDPPPHWCSKFRTVKGSPDWRPLRGPMKEISIQQTFSAISALFSELNASGYLTANAVSSVRSSSKKDLRMDVMRSFAEEDLDAIRRTMSEIEEGPNKRRLRAIILLLQTGGFRRGEAVSLKYRHLTQARKDNRLTDVWVAKFIGKGSKERQVPIKGDTFEALQAHYRDRLDLMQPVKGLVGGVATLKEGPLGLYKTMKYEDTPLLSILTDRMASGREATVGDSSGNARVAPNLDGSLSTARIHSILKGFFQKVAQRNDLVSGHANFEKASAHWLRHTFGLQAMIASNGDMASIQQILGHADISTTGIYFKANLDARVDVVEGVKGAV
jgi:site-specific recombinase XerD